MDMTLRFKKLLYAQVMLGVIAYAVAEQNVPMILAAGALSTLSWYIVEGPGGRPLPGWFINAGVLVAAAWAFYAQLVLRQPLILGLGQFILAVQLFKLYQRKTNRDYAQLIVLSLMQMICASIISAEIVYGALLAAYLLVTLFTVLQFQLKLGYDEVAEAYRLQAPGGRPAPRPRSIVSRGRRTHFRRFALVCGAMALVLSALFFVITPRGRGGGMLGDLETPNKTAVSGFNNQVQLAGGTRITTDRRPVMNVRISRGGRNAGSKERSFLLRGAVLDVYDPNRQRWTRSAAVSRADRTIRLENGNDDDAMDEIVLLETDPRAAPLVQEVTLRAETKGVLFSAHAPTRLATDQLGSLVFNGYDQALIAGHPISGGIDYVVESLESRTKNIAAQYPLPSPDERYLPWDAYARSPILGSEQLRTFTRSLLEEHGLERDPARQTGPQDERIANMIEEHLRTRYQYTLDLPPISQETDPILTFLFDSRRGHCEYFASAMCAMLRSVGIRSRVVTGFRATEYNGMGDYYVVREKNAHAWVEAWSPRLGWRTFDPSPPADIANIHRPDDGILAALREAYEFLEFQWINNVITYDDTQRLSVLSQLDVTLGGITAMGRGWLAAAVKWVRTLPDRWTLGRWGYLFVAVVAAVILACVAALVRMFIHRRQSIRQLQLDAANRRDQRRLARHLEFYLQMLKILHRAGYAKPVWQTPARFAERLTGTDPDRFADVIPLTDLFYEIRFGGRPLDTLRARMIGEHLDRLRQTV